MKIFPRDGRRIVEIMANVAIIVAATVILVNFLLAKLSSRRGFPAPSIGSSISLPDINWDKNGQTLIMVLQEGCKYCEESAPFYRRLLDLRSGEQPRIVAVIPGDRENSIRYLSERSVHADIVINSSLEAIKVGLTPTLLLVDHSGHITRVWVGKLGEKQEQEVIKQALKL